MAPRLQLIDGPVERALGVPRRLRNDFAHSAQPASPLSPLEPALRDYILLITILVAFLEATAQQLSPSGPALVMSFRGALDY